MGRFYKGLSVLSGIFVWSVTILPPTDGGNITWYKPPPLETITDPTVASKTNKTLTKGSLNEELSCEFSLTADLSIITVTMMFGINTIATYASLTVLVDPRFESRGNASWIPTELKLIVFNVTETDEGLYSCKVLTASGSWIREIQVTVLDQSRITFISVNQTVDVGDLLLLNCSASGIPPPVFSWTRLSDNRTVNMPLTITGKQDEGGYRCTADNKVGNPAASDVFVTVRYKPYHVSLKISKNEVCSGTMVTFTCSAAAANPAIQNYILHINDGSGGVNIRSNQQGVFRETLFTEGRHTYRCEACNSVGCTSSRNISVDVQAPASVTIANETVVVLEGGNVTLRCGFSGFPLPNVSWNTNSLSYIVDTESILKLLNISRCSDGVHTCSASNACGNDSKNVDIDVQYPVEATGSGENAKVANGGVKVFSCPVDGNPEPNIEWYSEKSGIKILSGKHLQATESGCYTCIASNSLGTPVNITQCLIVDPNLTLAPTTTVSQQSITSAPFTTQPTMAEPEGLAGPPWAIIGAVAGGVVILAIVVGVLTWWVHKQRKCRKDAKIHNSDLERHYDEGGYWQVPGAYAQSGPTAGNGIDSAAEQQIAEAAAPIPTYAVVDKSKKSKKQTDERPPEYAVVDKSKKKQKQESAAIPTYAAVDKSKKRKKSWEEVPPVYAEVDKSKKQKKKIDDKNLYETLDEPKKEKKPGELLYADLGDFQNAGMTRVSISPQPLLAIKKQDPYERTDYADITQFLKGDATLPPTDGNGDMEMKPERPSKKKMQGKDKETPN